MRDFMKSRLTQEDWEKCWRIVKQLLEFDWDGRVDDEALKCVEVLELLEREGCSYRIFKMLDERPGCFGYVHEGNREWHWKLRRMRNNARSFGYLDRFHALTRMI